MAQLMPSKKSVKVSFVTSGTEKIAKKVEDFLFSVFSLSLPGIYIIHYSVRKVAIGTNKFLEPLI